MPDEHEDLPFSRIDIDRQIADSQRRITAALNFCTALSTDFLEKHTIKVLDDIPPNVKTFGELQGFVGFIPVVKVNADE